jgi:uncharacterized protein YbjT (DUF2867 family)
LLRASRFARSFAAWARRTPGLRKAWRLRVGELTDTDVLAAALEGVEAAFLMQPTPIGVTREFAEAEALTGMPGPAA